MDDIKQIMEDPVKSKIMSFFVSKAKVHAEQIHGQVTAPGEELCKALDFLVSADLLTRSGNYYKRTQRAMKVVAVAVVGYEQTAKGLMGFETHIPLSGFILDIGCGAGYQLNALGKYSPNIVGIDIDPESLYVANLKSKAKLIRADAHFLPFKSNTFDMIICYGVTQQLKDEPRAIAEASRVLKKDGTILLNVHACGRYVRLMFRRNVEIRMRVGAAVAILNTFIYWLTGKKLKFKAYISTFQTETRMKKILKERQIEIIKFERIGRFVGLPIFIHLEGKKISEEKLEIFNSDGVRASPAKPYDDLGKAI